RPLIMRGYGTMGLFPLDAPVDVCIAVWEWGAYLGDEGKRNGVRAKVSSWRRISPDSLIPQAKASGQYLNSILAKIESHKAGYEEAILLDDHGYVCEGSGENVFVVRDGTIFTPPQTAGILDGINRKSCIQIARDLGFDVVDALDGLGIDLIEAGFPASNPKEAELFGLLEREKLEHAQIAAFGMTRRRDVRADEDPALRLLAESFAPVCTLVGKTWGLHLD